MTSIRITKTFSFEAAHALEGYDGLCANIHGHSYQLHVTLKGSPNDDPKSPKCGMVLDFGILKNIVQRTILSRLDHSLMLRKGSTILQAKENLPAKIEVFSFQPTCENLLPWMAANIAKELPDTLELYSLRLQETATSYAEWYAEDNPSRHSNCI